MTDEKLAEEYVNKHTHYEVGRRENGLAYAKQVSGVTVQQAFLDGLKLGRQDKQLPKARGLLRAWFQYCIDTKGKTPLKIETAQFLKDSEVEK